MREGRGIHEKFDVSDVEAEMAAKANKTKLGVKNAPRESRESTQEKGWEDKIAEAKRKIALAEGTGEIPLADEDIEEIPDLTSEAEEEN